MKGGNENPENYKQSAATWIDGRKVEVVYLTEKYEEDLEQRNTANRYSR